LAHATIHPAWKDTVWPYERLRERIKTLRRDRQVDAHWGADWRIAAHYVAQPPPSEPTIAATGLNGP
jgi:hypothetical protein